MLGLDRVALLLERQGRLARPPAKPAQAVAASELGSGLAEARARRAAGARIRFRVGAAR
jgi:hypothetical protein